jgi:DNA repair exonuclease SbcCD ATPase subunit
MVKKSLSDVLREEMKPQDSTESNLSSGEIAPVEKNEVSTDLETAIASANEKITILTTELATEKKQNKTLQSELEKANEFKTLLEEQKELVKKLTADLKKANTIQKSLETEKENAKTLSDKIKGLEQELGEQKVLVTKLYEELQQAEQKLLETPKSAQLAVKSTPSAIVPARRIGRYVAPAQPPVTLSDEVIGWFD